VTFYYKNHLRGVKVCKELSAELAAKEKELPVFGHGCGHQMAETSLELEEAKADTV
jgi:hypothetical protein